MERHIPGNVQAQLENIEAGLKKHVCVYGLYVHGSLAMRCFGPDSDVDILCVTDESTLTRETMLGLAKAMLDISNKPYPVEISLLAREDLRPFLHPAPYVFHYSEGWRERFENGLQDGTLFSECGAGGPALQKPTDRDLGAHLTITRKFGITLCGPPPEECFEPVPHEAYWDALIYDFEGLADDAEKNPVYAVLNACRVLAYYNERLYTSKESGGLYGLERLPEEWHGLICEALGLYRSGKQRQGENNVLTPHAVKSFITFATNSMSL